MHSPGRNAEQWRENGNLPNPSHLQHTRPHRSHTPQPHRSHRLQGNQICKEHDYRSYVLSHIKDLTYLDYRRVAQADVLQVGERGELEEGGQ